MAEDLKALRDIISSSIDNITTFCEKTGSPFPSLNEPFHPSELTSEGIRNNPNVSRSITLIVSAATQLIATVQPPPATMTISIFRYTLTASLGVVEAGNVAEILRDAGSQGLHVNEIAAKSNMDSKKLSRILRYLATEHWFREIRPNVFANNLLSSLLDSGRDISPALIMDTKYDNSSGMGPFAAYGADECLKSGSYLVEMMTDPSTKFSEEPNGSALQKAFTTTDSLFQIFDRPSEAFRLKRFAAVMAGANSIHSSRAILSAFDWDKLPAGSILVDVGGGLGHVSLEIAKAYPSLQIVLEDRPLVVEQAKPFWQSNLPEHVTMNRIHFIGTDFFEQQPELPGPVDIFLLRMIIHDWSDKYAIKLLRQLRGAASPRTKLVVIDSIIDHVCDASDESDRPPTPLLANLGGANLLAYSADVAVFGVLNAGERTIEGFREILTASGWSIAEIRKNTMSSVCRSSIISVPA